MPTSSIIKKIQGVSCKKKKIGITRSSTRIHKLIVDYHVVELKNNGVIAFDATIIVSNMNIVLTFDVVFICNIKKLLFKFETLPKKFGLIIKMDSKTNCLKVNLSSIKSVWILFLFVYHCKLLR